MKIGAIEEMLEADGFDLQGDKTDKNGYGSRLYVRSDEDELVQIEVTTELPEK